MIRVSVAEVRRFFIALLGSTGILLTHVLHWSNWRRHHQAVAMFFHYKASRGLEHLQL